MIRLPHALESTLGYIEGEHLTLQTWCMTCQKGGTNLDVAPLIRRFGATATVQELGKRFPCERCGGRTEIRVAVRELR